MILEYNTSTSLLQLLSVYGLRVPIPSAIYHSPTRYSYIEVVNHHDGKRLDMEGLPTIDNRKIKSPH